MENKSLFERVYKAGNSNAIVLIRLKKIRIIIIYFFNKLCKSMVEKLGRKFLFFETNTPP